MPEETQWITAQGTLIFDQNSRTIRVTFGYDFNRYYKWLVDRYYCFFTHLPAHGGHISVCLPSKHRKVSAIDLELLKEYLGKPVTFEYSPNIRVGGFSKPYRNFIIDVRSKQLDKIAKILHIDQNWHITVCNTKGGIRPYIMK
jgi:hypothetical protein